MSLRQVVIVAVFVLLLAGVIALTLPLVERDWNQIVEWWSR